MVFKPFTYLARQTFTKAFNHVYAQSVVAASQTSYASSTTFNQLASPAKFARTNQLQNVFSNPSSSSGAGAKTSQGGSGSGDFGLAAYYAAWQHAQQTGDDSDWRQFQFKRRIDYDGAKDQDEKDHVAPSCSNLPSPHLTKATANEDVSAKVEEAVAREIEIQEEQAQAEEALEAKENAAKTTSDAEELVPELPSDEAKAASEHIVQLATVEEYAEIPTAFEGMLKDGLTPTVDAYNALLVSAVQLHADTSQAIPKALDIYSDMLRRRVIPDEDTYMTLVQLFVGRAHQTIETKRVLEQDRVRYGGMEQPGAFMFHSSELESAILTEDNSLGIALKLFYTATARHSKLIFPLDMYRHLITVCAKEGRVEDMIRIYFHMETHKLTPHAEIFPHMIDAFASSGDLKSAVECYNEYRSLAMSDDAGVFSIVQRLDGAVYAAVVRAYLSCGKEAGALRFLERIRTSFEAVEDPDARKDAMESEVSARAFVQHCLKCGKFAQALERAKFDLHEDALHVAASRICLEAADAGDASAATDAYNLLPVDMDIRQAPAVAMLALYIRQGDLPAAKPFWSVLTSAAHATPSLVQPATMYSVALAKSGQVMEALTEVRNMFAQIRAGSSQAMAREQMNEGIDIISRVVMQSNAMVPPQASMALLWSMVESGGLIFPAAEHAIANLGPMGISQLSPRDLILALQVQAGVLANNAMSLDASHPDRFAYMLEVGLSSAVPMDEFTTRLVDQAMTKLVDIRPDVVARWQGHLSLTSSPSSFMSSRPTPVSEPMSLTSSEESFDPYAQATDFRGSALIAEELEKTNGRTENHLNEALIRLKNMRRIGRHPRYVTYAKLITAAAKSNRADLVHEVCGMAQRDVPLLPHYSIVKYGWVSILDAMVAGCLTLGDRNLAAKYHQELLELGATPSANTFGLYITTLKESTKTFDEATEALKIFHRAVAEGVEPTSFLYNALIGKLGKARRIDDCLMYFAEMRANNVRPTSVTYGTVVNALCRVSDERFAEEMFEEMESMPNYKPRPAPYNSMIQYFLNTKRDRNKVLAYYERMKARKIEPTMHTHKLLIDAYASLEPVDMRAAENVHDSIKVTGQHPEAVHYASLINGKGCVQHDMDAALEVFHSAVANPKVRPQPCLYQAVLEALVANHRVSESGAILEDMARRQVDMTPYIANTLIHGWAAEGDIVQSKAIYDGIGANKREPSTYESMTRAFLAAEQRDNAARIVQEMMSRGYPSAVAGKVLDLLGGTV